MPSTPPVGRILDQLRDNQSVTQSGLTAANIKDADETGVANVPILHVYTFGDAVTNSVDHVSEHKVRVIDVVVVKTAGAGAGGNTIQVKNGASAISNALDMNVADQLVVRAGTLDDATYVLAVGDALRVTNTKAGGNSACVVYVYCIRVS